MAQLDDRHEHHSELAEGVSANVPTTDEVQIKTPERNQPIAVRSD